MCVTSPYSRVKDGFLILPTMESAKLDLAWAIKLRLARKAALG